jgi:hypothetical protein
MRGTVESVLGRAHAWVMESRRNGAAIAVHALMTMR